MKDCMIDLETLGTRAGCTIMSIGAVMFDPEKDELGPRFYVTINRASCAKVGLHENAATIAWWEKQSPEARQIFEAVNSTSSETLYMALASFRKYLENHGGPNVRVWGNGADFDNAILQSAWEAGMSGDLPWKFWNNRCYRTLKGLAPWFKLVRVGTYHNALDDAISQAQHAMDIMHELGLSGRKTFLQRVAFSVKSLWN